MKRIYSFRSTMPLVLLVFGFALTAAFTLELVQSSFRMIESETRSRLESLGYGCARRLEYYSAQGYADLAERDLELLVKESYSLRGLLFEDSDVPTIAADSGIEGAPHAAQNEIAEALAEARSTMSPVLGMSKDSTLMSGAFPFHLGILPGEPKPARAGVLYLEFDLRDKKADAFRESMGRIFLIAGIIAFLLFALGLYLDIVIARRLGRLTTMAEKFAAGDYQVRLGMKGRDEIAELGMALDRMAAEIQARNLRIEKDLKDKEVLIKELYHRTKNNMQVICSFLDLQSSEIDDPKFKSCVVEMKNRIHSMSLVHQMLYRSKDLVHVNMKDYLGELTRLLVSGPTHSGGKVTLSMEMEEIPALIDVAMPCGLIVNELVSNSLKHAFPGGRPGNIRVSLSRSPAGKILLKVEDDGVGFPEGFDYRSEGHLGLQTLLALGETQLRGKVSIESAAGLSCLLEFDDSGIRPKANGDKARPDIA